MVEWLNGFNTNNVATLMVKIRSIPGECDCTTERSEASLRGQRELHTLRANAYKYLLTN